MKISHADLGKVLFFAAVLWLWPQSVDQPIDRSTGQFVGPSSDRLTDQSSAPSTLNTVTKSVSMNVKFKFIPWQKLANTKSSGKISWIKTPTGRAKNDRLPASSEERMLAILKLECFVQPNAAQSGKSGQLGNSQKSTVNSAGIKSSTIDWLRQQTDLKKLDLLTTSLQAANENFQTAAIQNSTKSLSKANTTQEIEIPEPVIALSFSKANISDTEAFTEQALADDCVLGIEPDVRHNIGQLPNDSLYSQQTHHSVIGSPQAWDFVQRPIRGANSKVKVAVIDTGVDYTHPDLKNRMWTNTDNTFGMNYVDNNTDPKDDHGTGTCPSGSGASHGTHVAGIIGAEFNNNTGVTGVNGISTQIMALKVADHCGSAYSSDIINALNFAAQNGAKVINISLGSGDASPATKTAMTSASNYGANIVIAAGNSTQSIGVNGFTYPCAYAKDVPGAICVASMDAVTNGISSFSNRSPSYVDIAAPGSADTQGIMSTIRDANYGAKQGTSMASPVVAGALSLAHSVALSNGMTLTPEQMKQLLLKTATKRSDFQSFVKDGNQLQIGTMIRTLYQQYVIQAQAGIDDL